MSSWNSRVRSCQADVQGHKATAINEPRICSQLICWYVLYYRASLDLTKTFPVTAADKAHVHVHTYAVDLPLLLKFDRDLEVVAPNCV